jgi:hypothetical protein
MLQNAVLNNEDLFALHPNPRYYWDDEMGEWDVLDM